MAAGDLVLTAAEILALKARLKATALEGGSFSSPEQKYAELASVLRDIVGGIAATG